MFPNLYNFLPYDKQASINNCFNLAHSFVVLFGFLSWETFTLPLHLNCSVYELRFPTFVAKIAGKVGN